MHTFLAIMDGLEAQHMILYDNGIHGRDRMGRERYYHYRNMVVLFLLHLVVQIPYVKRYLLNVIYGGMKDDGRWVA